MSLSSIPDLLADFKAGKMVILVDEEDRENEGDLVVAAQHVTPEIINFMARHARGLICLTLTEEHCRQINLPLMVRDNRSPHGTNFTLSIEAASGVTTGISAQDRARTVLVAAAPDARPEDIVQPGHIFPLMAQSGGVLMRAGHTEAGCDLAQLAGLSPAAVICEVLKEDGTMARLPDLEIFASEHGLKIGTIADLIHFRSENESLIRRVTEREIETAQGRFRLVVYLEKLSGAMHLALVLGDPSADDISLVRVHEPLSLVDLLETGFSTHTWSIPSALARIAANGSGDLVMLNCEQGAVDLIERVASSQPRRPPVKMDLLSYGIGAQILRDLGVRRMNLMTQPRKIPSMAGWQLEVLDFIAPDAPAPVPAPGVRPS